MILTIDDCREALYLDQDFPTKVLENYIKIADRFIFQKTGYDFGSELDKEPLAVLLAKLYIRELHFQQADKFNKNYDYTIGISSLIVDLQDIARRKLNG